MSLTPIQIESIKSEMIKNQREALREEFPFIIIGFFSKRLARKIKSHYYISKYSSEQPEQRERHHAERGDGVGER